MGAIEHLEGRTLVERRARCRRCRYILIDNEPESAFSEWFHRPLNDCPNAGKTLKDPEVIIHLDKSQLRARNRGARLAAKHRPH